MHSLSIPSVEPEETLAPMAHVEAITAPKFNNSIWYHTGFQQYINFKHIMTQTFILYDISKFT